jgi:MFS family permease
MSEFVPVEIRGRYFGLRNIFVGSSGMLVGYLSALYVDYWRGIEQEMIGFQSLFLLSAILGYLTLIMIAKLPETPSEPKKSDLKSILRSFQVPFRDKPFAKWILHRGCYSFAVGFSGPFFTVYLLKQLELPLATVAIYTALGQITSIALSRFWGSLADRIGNKTVLAISCVAKSIFPALWIFATGVDTIWAILWLGFVHSIRGFNSAQQITTLNLALWLSPEDSRAMYLACESTIVHLLAAFSPLVGGLILGLIGDRCAEISLLGWQHTLCGMHLLFLISAILRGSASTILVWIKSDAKREVSE